MAIRDGRTGPGDPDREEAGRSETGHSEAGREEAGHRDPDRGDASDKPAQLHGRSWWGVIKRTVAGFKRDGLNDWSAALTYYGVLSIFPALLALVSVLGLLGTSVTEPLLRNFGGLAPGPAREILTSAVQNVENTQATAGVALLIGLAVALWAASAYVAAFMRASNSVFEMPEGRPLWKVLPIRLGITAVLVVLLAASAIIVVFTGGLAARAGEVIGVGSTAVDIWNIAKWPVLVLIVAVILGILYWAAPNVRQAGFRWITPGSLLAVVIWILASAGFALYLAYFGSYNETYGAVAGVIVFLIWLWITNIAFLLGLEFDAEMQRGRAIEAGQPADHEPFAEPRDTRKFDQEQRNNVR